MNSPDKMAQTLLTHFNLDPKFNIFELVSYLGGKIIYADNLNMDAYVIKEYSGFTIVLNPNVSAKRQRFSIAHEIGHLFLHLHYLDDDKWNALDAKDSLKFRYGYDEEELEANEFAAELLMPKKAFLKSVDYYSEDGYVDVKAVAKSFGVSKDAVIYRGHKLRLWDMNS